MEEFLKNVIHDGFTENEVNGVKYYTVDKISDLGIVHAFTSRLGGVSPGVYESLNLSKTREENEQNKAENYKAVCSALGLDYNSLTLVNYEHGNNAYVLKAEDKGAGITKECGFEYCDALITDNPELTAVTLHADCTPVFTVDAKNRVVSAAHAGWRGTVSGIVCKVIEKMEDIYNSAPEDIIVAVGPHIMNCCFEIKGDTASELTGIDERSVKKRDNSMYGDLQYLILKQLYEKSILPENIICADLCTYCNKDLFYSHRRDRGLTGAMGAFINVGS